MYRNHLIFFAVALGISMMSSMNGDPFVSDYNLPSTESKNQSRAAFNTMMDVITHPRCINCHPNDNVPKQGDDSHPHTFGITRGIEGSGFEATSCITCHQTENNGYSGVPGAPHWSLAPASMGWQGLSRNEIAAQMLDVKTNGGKNHEELITHMTEDELVLWAWKPGIDANGMQRELPPVSEDDFKSAVKEWFKNGAIIPSE